MNALAPRDSSTDTLGVGVAVAGNPSNLGIEWDADNRLLAVNEGTRRSEFTYDGRSRRVRVIHKDNGNVILDRRLLWCEDTLCESRDSSGSSVAQRFFAYGLSESASGFFYTHDHSGSIRELVDINESVRARYEYRPFGLATKTGDMESPFQFSGYYRDGQTGVSLTWFRAYDPTDGRWLTEEPLGFFEGTNFYTFVRSNPLKWTDTFGLASCCPDGRAASFWLCYPQCVNDYLIDPALFGLSMAAANFGSTLWNAPVTGVSTSLTRGQHLTSVIAIMTMARLNLVTPQLLPQVHLAAKALGGAIGTVATAAATAMVVYASGAVLGCATACGINPCAF